MVIRKAFTFWWKQMHITPNFVDLKKVAIFVVIKYFPFEYQQIE